MHNNISIKLIKKIVQKETICVQIFQQKKFNIYGLINIDKSSHQTKIKE